MNTNYHGHVIQPKRDWGHRTEPHGFVVTKRGFNVMPGGCWFETVAEAKRAIDVLNQVKGNADRFWEIMQPFEYKRIGQKADFENGHVTQGRFTAYIRGFTVVGLRTQNKCGSVTIRGTV